MIWQNPDCSLNLIVTLCPHHMRVKFNNGLSDADTYRAIKASYAIREKARYAAKLALKLDKEHPGLPYVVGTDGTFTVLSGVTGPARTAVRSAVDASIAGLERPTGTSAVVIA